VGLEFATIRVIRWRRHFGLAQCPDTKLEVDPFDLEFVLEFELELEVLIEVQLSNVHLDKAFFKGHSM
jgi:hypothetical protein